MKKPQKDIDPDKEKIKSNSSKKSKKKQTMTKTTILPIPVLTRINRDYVKASSSVRNILKDLRGQQELIRKEKNDFHLKQRR